MSKTSKKCYREVIPLHISGSYSGGASLHQRMQEAVATELSKIKRTRKEFPVCCGMPVDARMAGGYLYLECKMYAPLS